MASFRKHIAKDGTVTYLWRAKVPFKTAEGKIEWRRVERSTHAGTLIEARESARRIEAEYHERANVTLAPEEMTFADAAIGYMKSGGEAVHLPEIIELIGDRPLSEINQNIVQAVAERLKPGRTASTVNRHIFTPIMAVLNFAARLGMSRKPLLIRPRGHEKSPPLDIPPHEWFEAVMPVLSPQIRALVLLTTLHGLRLSEAIERVPADVDPRTWRLSIPTTKTGEPVSIPLSDPVIEAIKAIPAWRNKRWLFGTCHRSNIARSIKRACAKVGVRKYGTHAIGRHSFATRLLEDGKSIKFVMNAGRWKTARMPMMRYGHLEQSEVNTEVNSVASRWASQGGENTVVRLKK